jgi:hypothetical protein
MRNVVALLALFPLAAAAQERAPSPHFAPDPARAAPPSQSIPASGTHSQAATPNARPRNQRDRWYIGFGLGYGDGSVSDSSGTWSFDDPIGGRTAKAMVNFKIGATLSPKLLLGLDWTSGGAALSPKLPLGFSWVRKAADQIVENAVVMNNFNAVTTYFPIEQGPFIRGGAGLSKLEVLVAGVTETYRGVNVLGGAGYAFWIGKAFNLTVNLDASRQFYWDSGPNSSTFWSMYLGFDWY